MKKKIDNIQMLEVVNLIKENIAINFRIYWGILRHETGKDAVCKFIMYLRVCNEIKRLIDKETPKFLKSHREGGDNGQGIFSYKYYCCPVCGTTLACAIKNKKIKYCHCCGQRVK